jgi:hypothetical protein
MAPTLRDADAVLAWCGGRAPRRNDIVLARFASRPDLLVVKRAVRPDGPLWWVEGDNPYGSDDSRSYGPAQVVGRVILRYWPRPRLLWRAGGDVLRPGH